MVYHHDGSMFELTDEQIERLLKAAGGRDKLVICLMLWAGLRRVEVSFLKWEDVDLAGARLNLKHTKYNKPRVVPLRPELLEMLREWGSHSGGEWVVPQKWDASKHLSQFGVWRVCRDVAERAEVASPNPGRKSIGCHVLRHSYARRARKAGIRIESLQRILGHDDPGLTMRLYSSPSQDEIRQDFEQHLAPVQPIDEKKKEDPAEFYIR